MAPRSGSRVCLRPWSRLWWSGFRWADVARVTAAGLALVYLDRRHQGCPGRTVWLPVSALRVVAL